MSFLLRQHHERIYGAELSFVKVYMDIIHYIAQIFKYYLCIFFRASPAAYFADSQRISVDTKMHIKIRKSHHIDPFG